MSSALAVVHLLAARPDSGCLIDVVRLSSSTGAVTTDGIEATIVDKAAVQSGIDLRKLDLSLKNNTAGLIESIKPVTNEYKKRISCIENIMNLEVSNDALITPEEFSRTPLEASRTFLEEQINVIEKNRSDLGPYLTDIPVRFSMIAGNFRKVARTLSRHENRRNSTLRKYLFSMAKSLSLGAKEMQEASVVQFRYLLLLKVIRGALEDQEKSSPICSAEEMEDLLNEVWA